MEEKPRPADAWIEEISKWVAPGERMLLLGDGVSVIETASRQGKCWRICLSSPMWRPLTIPLYARLRSFSGTSNVG